MSRRSPVIPALLLALSLAVTGCSFVERLHPPRHNLILFVADGLRYGAVEPETAPEMAAVKAEGVDFQNSHSMYPTLTTVNASAFATGHGIGDTGDFANAAFVGLAPLPAAAPARVVFYEDDQILADMNRRFAPSYLDEESLLAAARKAGYQTAAVGKLGPIRIQDLASTDGKGTIVVDDATGWDGFGGAPLPADVARAMTAAGLGTQAPDRGLNGDPGDFIRPGVIRTNAEQQDWFTRVVTDVLLPRFKAKHQPFAMVFWSRDPDGTQHNQGDSLNQLVPGINGPTSLKAVHNADDDLKRLRAALKAQGLDKTTDIVVVADHGFSTISRQSRTSGAARRSYRDVPPGFLPPGFLAIDLSQALGLQLNDGYGLEIDLAHGFHPKDGSAVLGDPNKPEAIVAANGGSDLIWLPQADAKVIAPRIVAALQAQDYTAAVFVDDRLGAVPGTLPTSAIGLQGRHSTPAPAIVVSFRSFGTGCANPQMCAADVADTSLQQGQGMHGSLSRADTHNFMAAVGPDFKAGFKDTAPVNNADIGATLAHVLGLDIAPRGSLLGRVAEEALRGGPAPAAATRRDLASAPGAGGFTTVLHEQLLAGHAYYDSAGAPGRVVR
jgi:arylsulfatase A-like enzyme